MHITVVFDHVPNAEEIEAHGQSPEAWELMFREYLASSLTFDPNITTIVDVGVSPGQLPTAPDPRLVY